MLLGLLAPADSTLPTWSSSILTSLPHIPSPVSLSGSPLCSLFVFRVIYVPTMWYGQLVIGPPGSGKSSYCFGMQQMLIALERRHIVVNLDPMNDLLPYKCDIDVMDLVKGEDVMKVHKLGPNGGTAHHWPATSVCLFGYFPLRFFLGVSLLSSSHARRCLPHTLCFSLRGYTSFSVSETAETFRPMGRSRWSL